jgi:hypothetical protein
MSQVVWRSDRRVQKYLERRAENYLRYLEPVQMEKCPKRLKRPKHPDTRLCIFKQARFPRDMLIHLLPLLDPCSPLSHLVRRLRHQAFGKCLVRKLALLGLVNCLSQTPWQYPICSGDGQLYC